MFSLQISIVGYTRGHLHERVDGYKQKSCLNIILANITSAFNVNSRLPIF